MDQRLKNTGLALFLKFSEAFHMVFHLNSPDLRLAQLGVRLRASVTSSRALISWSEGRAVQQKPFKSTSVWHGGARISVLLLHEAIDDQGFQWVADKALRFQPGRRRSPDTAAYQTGWQSCCLQTHTEEARCSGPFHTGRNTTTCNRRGEIRLCCMAPTRWRHVNNSWHFSAANWNLWRHHFKDESHQNYDIYCNKLDPALMNYTNWIKVM